ncbi:ATP-binding protein [Kitasatospora indigofera]|uniref:ATP-binding protein n=1 Tax=Kitasatospora indigofera TaxID=67307 RepID=UPI0036A20D40
MPATATTQSRTTPGPSAQPRTQQPRATQPRTTARPTVQQPTVQHQTVRQPTVQHPALQQRPDRSARTTQAGRADGADRWQARFTAAPDSVGGVRSAVRRYFDQVRPGRPQERDDLLLVVSELVTNAVRHAGGAGTVDLALLPDAVDIAVSDPSRTLPLPRLPDPGAGTGGLGLHLVAALCGPVRVTLDPGSGKTVHARLPYRRPPAPAPTPAPRRRSW